MRALDFASKGSRIEYKASRAAISGSDGVGGGETGTGVGGAFAGAGAGNASKARAVASAPAISGAGLAGFSYSRTNFVTKSATSPFA